MEYNKKISVAFILSIFIIAYMFVLYIFSINSTSIGEESPKQEEVITVEDFDYNSDLVMITAAHIKNKSFDGYTCVWKDEDTDRAIYVKDNYVPSELVSVGDIVIFEDEPCNVTEVTEQGFVINIGKHPQHGMSGTDVYYKGEVIAFVSQAVSTREIYCVYR